MYPIERIRDIHELELFLGHSTSGAICEDHGSNRLPQNRQSEPQHKPRSYEDQETIRVECFGLNDKGELYSKLCDKCEHPQPNCVYSIRKKETKS
ncbi:MAG: hypothetical protein WC413_03320 [Candidatus Nanoarchaeia archaeon]